MLGEKLKSKKKMCSKKKKNNLELSKELFITNGENIEKNVINLLKNNDSSRK